MGSVQLANLVLSFHSSTLTSKNELKSQWGPQVCAVELVNAGDGRCCGRSPRASGGAAWVGGEALRPPTTAALGSPAID